MAIIQQIRDKSWLLIILIGLGLGGFLLMDMLGQNSIFGAPPTKMGEINGAEVDYNEFTKRLNTVYGSGDYATREQLWNFYVREKLIEQEAAALGLIVSGEELKDRIFGAQPDPAVTQRFMNPQTRQLNREQLNNIRQAIDGGQFLDPNARVQWDQLEREVLNNTLTNKLATLVSKGMYIPTWMAQKMNVEQNQNMDFRYVRIPFSTIDESEVNLTDADFQAYLDKNVNRYVRDKETRVLDYVVFDVVASAQDTLDLTAEMEQVATDLRSADNDTIQIERDQGIIENAFVHIDKLPEMLQDSSMDLSVGAVNGPYEEGNGYTVMKVLERRMVADSVRSRHILRSVDQQNPDYEQAIADARNFMDSLANLIETGQATFDTLAKLHGQDATAPKGGDLDYSVPGRMVPEFDRFIFVDGEVGKPEIVQTQFGIHLVEVTDRKNIREAIRSGYVRRPIIPSSETINAVRTKALTFAAENRDKASFESKANEMGLEIQTTAPLEENSYLIPGLSSGDEGRDLVQWAYEDDISVGDVSSDAYSFDNQQLQYEYKFAVIALADILEPGKPTVDQVRENIRSFVMNEKKGEMIKSKISSTDLSQVAQNFDAVIDTASNVVFSAPFVPGLGREPKVIAAAFGTEKGQTTQPVVGSGGVYLAQVTDKKAVGPANMQILRSSAEQQISTQVPNRLLQSIISASEIEDMRARFDYR